MLIASLFMRLLHLFWELYSQNFRPLQCFSLLYQTKILFYIDQKMDHLLFHYSSIFFTFGSPCSSVLFYFCPTLYESFILFHFLFPLILIMYWFALHIVVHILPIFLHILNLFIHINATHSFYFSLYLSIQYFAFWTAFTMCTVFACNTVCCLPWCVLFCCEQLLSIILWACTHQQLCSF